MARDSIESDASKAIWKVTSRGLSFSRFASTWYQTFVQPAEASQKVVEVPLDYDLKFAVNVPPQLRDRVKQQTDVFFVGDCLEGLVKEAQRDLVIISPYFDEASILIMSKANVQNVKVRVLTAEILDSRTGRIDERHVSTLKKYRSLFPQFECRVFSKYEVQNPGSQGLSQTFISHAKTYIADSKRMLVTSANLKATSLIWNFEVGVYTDNPELLRQALAVFTIIWENSTVPAWI